MCWIEEPKHHSNRQNSGLAIGSAMSIELFRTLRIEDPAHLGFAYRVALCRIRHREATDRRGTRVVMEGCDAAIPASEGMENSPETSRRGLWAIGEAERLDL